MSSIACDQKNLKKLIAQENTEKFLFVKRVKEIHSLSMLTDTFQ